MLISKQRLVFKCQLARIIFILHLLPTIDFSPYQSGMELCNCDENDNVWRIDSGLFTTLSEFPVKEVSLGDLGSPDEAAQVVLHPMLCTGKSTLVIGRRRTQVISQMSR